VYRELLANFKGIPTKEKKEGPKTEHQVARKGAMLNKWAGVDERADRRETDLMEVTIETHKSMKREEKIDRDKSLPREKNSA